MMPVVEEPRREEALRGEHVRIGRHATRRQANRTWHGAFRRIGVSA
jgi:hypothetical protein